MRLVILLTVAWATGVAVYLFALEAINGQSISQNDLRAVLLWSALSFVFAALIFYLPALFILRRALGGTRPAWVFVLAAVIMGIVPFLTLNATWGDRSWRSLLSAEAGLFYALFAAVGIVLGFGFSRLYR